MTATIAERVAAGAAFLDEHEPGWDQRIDLDKLDIATSCNCILGQLHGNYITGLAEHASSRDWDIRFGFMWNTTRKPADREREADDLTAEWRRVIEARRSA